MSFWNIFDPLKPTGIKDSDAVLDFPIDFSAWLSDMGATYVSHTITTTGTIAINSSTQNAGVITPIISGGTVGEIASFTIRIIASVGGSQRIDDRTFYLNIVNR